MIAYIVRRVVSGHHPDLVMSLVTFLLFFASPIDPARVSCGKNCSPALQAPDPQGARLRQAGHRPVG